MRTAGMPLWERLLLQAGFFAVMGLCVAWTLGVLALFAAGAAVCRLLPASWRPTWPAPPIPEPGAADCPGCRSPLVAEPVVEATQRGVCPACRCAFVRTYHRTTCGGFWSPWGAAEV